MGRLNTTDKIALARRLLGECPLERDRKKHTEMQKDLIETFEMIERRTEQTMKQKMTKMISGAMVRDASLQKIIKAMEDL